MKYIVRFMESWVYHAISPNANLKFKFLGYGFKKSLD